MKKIRKVNDRQILLILIFSIIFFLSRMIILFYSPYIFHAEEYKTASLGHDLVFGKKLRIPIFGYLDSPHAGGSLLVQFEIIPFYILFGNRFLAVKATAIFNSLILYFISVYLLIKYFAKINIAIFSLFYILSTPHFLQKSVMIHGNSILLALFLLLAVIQIAKVFINRKFSKKQFSLLGFILGLGLWTYYGFISIILTTLFMTVLFHKKISVKHVFSLSISFVLGFSPWIIYNLLYGFPSIFGDVLLYQKSLELSEFPSRLFTFFILHLPRSFHFLNFWIIDSKTLSFLFYFLFILTTLLSITYLLKKFNFSVLFNKKCSTRNRSIIFFLFIIFYVSFTSFLFNFVNSPVGNGDAKFNSMDVHFEHLILFFQPFIFIITGISISVLIKNKNKLVVAFGIMSFLIMITIMSMGCYTVLAHPKFNSYLLYPPEYVTIPNAIEAGFNYVIYPYAFEKMFNEITDEELKMNYLKGAGVGMSNYLSDREINADTLQEFNSILSILNPEEKKIVFTGLIVGEPYIDPESIMTGLTSEKIIQILIYLNEEDKEIFNLVLDGDI